MRGYVHTLIRMAYCQSREPGFEFSCCCFETLATSFNPRCHSSLSCINEYLAIDMWICERIVCAVIAA